MADLANLATNEIVVSFIFPNGTAHELRCLAVPVVGDDVYFRGTFYRVVKRLQVFAQITEGTIFDVDNWHVLLAYAPIPDWTGPKSV